MEKVKTPVKISDSEWEIMRVIWTLGQTTAQEITQILADSMDWKSATIKTLLGRLVKKEVIWTEQEGKKFIYHPAVSEMETVRSATLVKKEVIWTEQEGKKFIYHPAVSEMETVRSATENLFSHICAKRIGETIADLVEEATLTQEDINEILKQLEQKQPVETIECNCIPGQCECKQHQ